MSTKKSTDGASGSASRLKAMQSKHVRVEPAEAPETVSASVRGAPEGGAGPMGNLRAAGGGEGGRAAILQKLRQALSGPDGRINQQKARFALMFIRKQAADPAAPRHELAKRIEGMIRNMPPQQRQRLIAAAGMGGSGFGGEQNRAGPRDGAARANAWGGAGQGEAWFDNFLDKL
jgi:hypothetical protein